MVARNTPGLRSTGVATLVAVAGRFLSEEFVTGLGGDFTIAAARRLGLPVTARGSS